LGSDGRVGDVIEGSASAKAGIGPGMKVVAVNGKAYSSEFCATQLRRQPIHAAAHRFS
jgi:predicted metalloprotease with PDZ domain